MRRVKAKNKSEKCKLGRCLGKKVYPIEKPRFCAKHVDKAEAPVFTEVVAKSAERDYESEVPTGKSFLQHIKSFIFVDQ